MLLIVASIFLTASVPVVNLDVDPIVKMAVENCKNVSPKRHDEAIRVAAILYDVEKKYNVPSSMRGMILAAACMESGFKPTAKGDRKFSKDKKTPKAIGVLQQWRIYEKIYGTVRTDPRSAAEGWMRHIVRMIPRVKKQCKYKTEEKIWVAAWVTGIRYRKPGGRCREKPKHLRLLRKWKKLFDNAGINDTKNMNEYDTNVK